MVGVLDVAGQLEQQVVGLVDDLGDARVGPVDLVDHQDHRQPGLQGLTQHEPGLRQRALARVHQQHDTVHHGQPALDLATEVGVARGVDHVDGDLAVRRLAVDRGVLRQDGDALFALELTGVHDAVDELGALGKGAGLPEHGIDQGGLAVVDVGDDGDVAQVRPDLPGRPVGFDRGAGCGHAKTPEPLLGGWPRKPVRHRVAGSGHTRTSPGYR